MAQCQKNWIDLSLALFVLIFIAASTGLEILGTYWNQYNITQGRVTGNTYIIIGNVMAVFGSFAAIGILSKAFLTNPMIASIIVFLILIGFVLDLYITMFAETSEIGDAVAYGVLAFNVIPRLVAVLLGYGICDVPTLIGAARTLTGSRRR